MTDQILRISNRLIRNRISLRPLTLLLSYFSFPLFLRLPRLYATLLRKSNRVLMKVNIIPSNIVFEERVSNFKRSRVNSYSKCYFYRRLFIGNLREKNSIFKILEYFIFI